MDQILIEHNPSEAKLDVMGIYGWPVWSKEVSTFPWSYDRQETCYIIEGEVTVTPEGGDPVEIVSGDLVTFPKGMNCTWEIREDIKKYYNFE
ncbi:MAG: cupin domain-containing protein [Gammaproteobacteria bacterium]|jgi:uncharacterized cupin superfamily protein